MATLLQDLRYGLRMLRKAPGFTLVAILTLALGIGLNTTIFGALKSLIRLEPPVRDAGEIATVWATRLQSGIERSMVSLPEFQEIRARNTSFESMTACADTQFRLRGEESATSVSGARVSANFFHFVGVEPALGRLIQAGDDAPGAELVAVVSYGLWQRRLGADPQILGRTIWLDKRGFTIVGVMSRDFWFPFRGGADVWIPLVPGPADAQAGRRKFRAYARLKEGVSIEQARSEMNTLARSLEREFPETSTGWGFHPILFREEQSKRTGFGIAFLFLPVFFVLLIACGNVTNLLLARATSRRQEIAMRAALGADRARLLRQFLTEGTLLAVMASVLGILLAYAGIHLFRTIVLAHVPDLADTVHMDSRVFAFALFLCILTPLLFGLAPALQASRLDLVEALKVGGQASGVSGKQRRERSLLVLIEVALVVVMLIPMGLVLRTMLRIGQIDVGFESEHLLTLPIQLSSEDYPDEQQVQVFLRNLLERTADVPGVQSAAASDGFPGLFGARPGGDIIILEEVSGQGVRAGLPASRKGITRGYFTALGLALLRGRDFTDADSTSAPRVAVVSDTTARRFWPNRDPLGRRFRFPGAGDSAGWLTVVGVVADLKVNIPGAPAVTEARLPAQVYTPLAQLNERSIHLIVRTQAAPSGLMPALKSAIRALDNRLPVDDLKTVRQSVSNYASQGNAVVGMLGAFAGLALVLAAVGVYGVLSFLSSQRTREIGVRMALGAQRRQIFQMVLQQGMRPVFGGLVVGYAGGYALAQILAREIGQFGVKPTDLATFSAVALVIVSVALLACFVPARRATQVDPMASLRCE